MELTEFLTGITGLDTYPLEFPYNSEQEDVLVVDIINGTYDGSDTSMYIQLMARSVHPSVAEEMCYDVIQLLHNQTDLYFSGQQIILITANNPNPFFTGQDKNNKYLFTIDFTILLG
jgi:hypothetical protein